MFALPYLVLMIAWAGSNPPGAAPDEPDHLVKALGMATLDIGRPYTGPPGSDSLGDVRNASISRVVTIPARLSPDGYACQARYANETAACLPQQAPGGSGTVEVVTPLGSYPPFLYVPIGLVASLASTPFQAFMLARVACIAMAEVLLLLGAWFLVRTLGRMALIGAFVAMTPMAVFTSSAAGLSGVEITAAFAVATVAISALRKPEVLQQPLGQMMLAGVGAVLILSRQLGVVTFGVIIVLLIARLGWRYFWDLLRARQPTLLAGVAVLGASTLAITLWEQAFDNPVNTDPPFQMLAVGAFDTSAYSVLQSAIGNFGWLETPMPRWAFLAYILVLVVFVGSAMVLGRAADRWALLVWPLATVLLAYVAYSSVFFPVEAGLQGRHVLPFFMIVPVLAGVVLGEALGALDAAALRRVVLTVAAVLPVLQFTGIYVNSIRYAVGVNGPIFFLPSARWQPGLGWIPWLLLAALGSALLSVAIFRCRPDMEIGQRQELARVGG